MTQKCECGCGEPAPIATKTQTRFGWIKGQPMRFIRGHANRRDIPDYYEEDRGYVTPCWIWNRGINKRTGYGQLGKKTGHRVYYARLYGPIPPGLEIDHLCRVRECCNPEHLEAVTHAVNSQRSPLIGRWERKRAS